MYSLRAEDACHLSQKPNRKRVTETWCVPQSLKYLVPGSFWKKFPEPWLRCVMWGDRTPER